MIRDIHQLITAPWAYYSAHSSTCGKNTEEAHSSQRTQVFTSSRSYSYSLGLFHDIGDGIHMETNFCEMFEARRSIRWTRAEGVRRSQWTGFNLARQTLSYSLGSRQWTDIDLVRLSPSKYLGFSSLCCVVGLQTGFLRTMGVKELSVEFERSGRLGPATFHETHDWG